MAVTYPTEFAPELEILEPHMLRQPVGSRALQAMADHGFVMGVGMPEVTASVIGDMARQPHIVEQCPNDPERFGDEKLTREWLKKGRMPLVGYVVTQFDPGDSLEGKYHRLTMADLEPVEWSWYGYKHNDYLSDAHVTTAYRVGERGQQAARERRIDDQDTFKLGLPLGQITTAFALQHGVNWYELSLETNASNIHANKLYDLMHYREDPDVPPEDIVRPTLHQAGEIINGHTVYFDEELGRNMVRDKRLYKRYDPMGIRTVRERIIRHSIDN